MEQEEAARRYWTVAELAELWRVSERTVRRAIKAGHLQVVRIRGSVRISEAERLRYMREGPYRQG